MAVDVVRRYAAAARALAAQLRKFENAPPVEEMSQGDETASFWALVPNVGPIAARLAAYDEDYGVGKGPSLPPQQLVLDLPADRPLVPGVHTTAPSDEPLPSPRGGAPPVTAPSFAGGAFKLKAPATALGEPPVQPPPTPRGRPDPPPTTAPVMPRGRPDPVALPPPPTMARGRPVPEDDAPLPTPRGRPAQPYDAMMPASKQASVVTCLLMAS